MKNFCVAPFIHMYVHNNEHNRVCCMSTESDLFNDSTVTDLQAHWKSDYYRKLRRKFLDDEQPEICNKCFKLEEAGGISDRQRFNNEYLGKFKPSVIYGNEYGSPLDLDIRPGNLCNLKCRMCGPSSSTQIRKEIKENPILIEILGKGDIATSNMLSDENNIEFLLRNVDKGRRIKFLGGEPTIMPEVDRFLDILIEREMFDVPLHFTTNCTNSNTRFIDKISKFKQLTFNYSVDGVGKVVEYIRDPVKFNSINTNIQTYHNISWYGQISYTLQAYNFFNLLETLDWANNLGIYVRPEILRYPEWDSFKSIPFLRRRKKIKIMHKMKNNYSKEQWDLIDPVLELIYYEINEDDPIELARATKLYDIARKQHIKDYIPEVWDFIKEDYNALQI